MPIVHTETDLETLHEAVGGAQREREEVLAREGIDVDVGRCVHLGSPRADPGFRVLTDDADVDRAADADEAAAMPPLIVKVLIVSTALTFTDCAPFTPLRSKLIFASSPIEAQVCRDDRHADRARDADEPPPPAITMPKRFSEETACTASPRKAPSVVRPPLVDPCRR